MGDYRRHRLVFEKTAQRLRPRSSVDSSRKSASPIFPIVSALDQSPVQLHLRGDPFPTRPSSISSATLTPYIYQPDCAFNMDTFQANPATTRVATFNARGEERWFPGNGTLDALGPVVRLHAADLMPPVEIDGDRVDGALGLTALRLATASSSSHASTTTRQRPHARQRRRATAVRFEGGTAPRPLTLWA